MNDLLEQATVAGRAGDKEKAHLLLARLIKEEPRNAQAWYLLSGIVESPDQRLIFIRRALAIDPGHVAARQQLAQMVGGSKKTAVAAPPAVAPPPIVEPATPPQPVIEQATPHQPFAEPETPSAPQPVSPPVAEPPIISPALVPPSQTDDFLAQAEGDSMPDWLAEEGEPFLLETTDAAGQLANQPVAESLDLPDWLQEEPEPGWSVDAPVDAPADAPAASAPEPVKATKPDKPASVALTKVVKTPTSGSPDRLLIIGLSLAAIIVLIFFVIAVANTLF